MHGGPIKFPFKDAAQTIPDLDAFYAMSSEQIISAIAELKLAGRMDVLLQIQAEERRRKASQELLLKQAESFTQQAAESKTKIDFLQTQKNVLYSQKTELRQQHVGNIKNITDQHFTETEPKKKKNGGCTIS